MRPLLALLRKEYRQLLRDRLIVAQLLLMPVIQLLVLANAATFEVRRATVAVVDHDRSAASRGLVARLEASGRFTTVAATTSSAAGDALLEQGRVDGVLRLSAGLARDLERDGIATVQFVADAEDGAAAATLAGYVRRIAADHAAALETARPTATPAPVLDVRTRTLHNPALDYRHYMVPGILVQLVTMIGSLLTALNIVREKELGTLEQLNVSPVTRTQFIVSKLVPLWSFALVALALGLLVGRLAFGMPMRGSLLLVFATAGVYLVVALGLGLLVSTMVETQQQAIFVTFFVVMIYLLMSGLFTPLASMPGWAQAIATLNPMRHYVEVVRAIVLKGAGPADVAGRMAILAGMGVAVLGLAVLRYRRVTA